MRYSLIIFCVLILGTTEISSQSPSQEVSISEESYSELKEKLGYDKTKKGLRLRDRFKPERIEEETPESNFGGGVLLTLISYMLIAALVILLIYLIFGNIQVDKKVEIPDDQSEFIEDIEKVDAESAYRTALANGDHRLAVRMLFIMVLKKLNEAEIIQWEIEKTNRQYHNEISQSEMRRSFRELSSIYERVWYGDSELDSYTFRQHDQRFLAYLNTMS